jgi:hypothetical protein
VVFEQRSDSVFISYFQLVREESMGT